MSEQHNNTKSVMGLNVNLGQLTAALGPLGLVVWQGMAWASEIEKNVEENQEQIAELIDLVESSEERRDKTNDQVLKLLERLVKDDAEERARPIDETEPDD